MWDKIADFIRAIEPLILIIVPLLFSVWIKLKSKLLEEKVKTEQKINGKSKEQFNDWRHSESIRIINKLKEVCNYHCDISKVHASYLQLENGTLATSKLCNMFFSCIAEDSRYSKLNKLTNTIQRKPFTMLADWFNTTYNSEHSVVYLTSKEQIGDTLYDLGIRCMVTSLVRDPKGLVIGVCNFIFDEEKTITELDEDFEQQMLKFASSIETIFLTYDINTKAKRKELHLPEEDV